jgi:hypothetical protein
MGVFLEFQLGWPMVPMAGFGSGVGTQAGGVAGGVRRVYLQDYPMGNSGLSFLSAIATSSAPHQNASGRNTLQSAWLRSRISG